MTLAAEQGAELGSSSGPDEIDTCQAVWIFSAKASTTADPFHSCITLITPGILEGKAGTGGIVNGTALVWEDRPAQASYHEHCGDPQNGSPASTKARKNRKSFLT